LERRDRLISLLPWESTRRRKKKYGRSGGGKKVLKKEKTLDGDRPTYFIMEKMWIKSKGGVEGKKKKKKGNRAKTHRRTSRPSNYEKVKPTEQPEGNKKKNERGSRRLGDMSSKGKFEMKPGLTRNPGLGMEKDL